MSKKPGETTEKRQNQRKTFIYEEKLAFIRFKIFVQRCFQVYFHKKYGKVLTQWSKEDAPVKKLNQKRCSTGEEPDNMPVFFQNDLLESDIIAFSLLGALINLHVFTQ